MRAISGYLRSHLFCSGQVYADAPLVSCEAVQGARQAQDGSERMPAANDYVGAAESCEEEARRLTGEAAQARLQDAIKHYKKAKQHLLGFQLLQRHPHLAQNMTAEVTSCAPCLLALTFIV